MALYDALPGPAGQLIAVGAVRRVAVPLLVCALGALGSACETLKVQSKPLPSDHRGFRETNPGCLVGHTSRRLGPWEYHSVHQVYAFARPGDAPGANPCAYLFHPVSPAVRPMGGFHNPEGHHGDDSDGAAR